MRKDDYICGCNACEARRKNGRKYYQKKKNEPEFKAKIKERNKKRRPWLKMDLTEGNEAWRELSDR